MFYVTGEGQKYKGSGIHFYPKEYGKNIIGIRFIWLGKVTHKEWSIRYTRRLKRLRFTYRRVLNQETVDHNSLFNNKDLCVFINSFYKEKSVVIPLRKAHHVT